MPLPDILRDSLSLPVVAAPMFLVSAPKLVAACCHSGIVGSFPALNQRTTAGFQDWVRSIKTELAASERPAPFAVNLVVHRSNPRVQDDLAVCVAERVPIVITSLGAMREVVDAVHSYGGIVFHDVTNRKHAKKAATVGVDGLIAVCAGAGGHAGTTSPFALVSEIRRFFGGTLLLAGCINTGRDVAAAIQMGADLAYMGTRFINTHESEAIADYKQMIVDCHAEDIVHTPAVSGVPANFLRPSLELAGYDMTTLLRPGAIDYGNKLKPAADEAAVWKTVWSAGQGCAGIDDICGAAELVARLKTEFRVAVAEQQTTAQHYT